MAERPPLFIMAIFNYANNYTSSAWRIICAQFCVCFFLHRTRLYTCSCYQLVIKSFRLSHHRDRISDN